MTRAALTISALLAATACAPAGGPSDADAGTATTEAETATTEAGGAGEAVTDAERQQVVAALQAVFDALRTGDADLLRSVMDPGVVMHFTQTDASGSTSHGSSTVEGLAARIQASDAPLIERMWDPVVRVDGALASIWTPYDFYTGATFSHCGTDVATLVRRDGRWTVVSLSWTRRQPPACALHPDGPPQP